MRIFAIIIIFLYNAFSLSATHIVGGEIYYDYTGNDNYQITLKVYRDCSANNTNGTGFDNPAPIAIYSGGILLQTLSVTIQGITSVPVVINDPCLQAPGNVCVEQATYITTVNLPPNIDGYDIVYQRCCRNPSIINLVNGSNYGATYYAKIPGSGVVAGNSSPRFSNLPPLVICSNSSFSFDHSATDPDGDQLVYSFYTPFDGGDQVNPAPNPPLPPPFNNVIWQTGYSVTDQIHGTPNLTIDPNTGSLSGVPNTLGLHVYGVKVSEYRNGQLISEAYREFQTTVTSCPSVVVSSIPAQTNFCTGPTVTPANASQNAVYYHWDFGVNNTLSDTSNLYLPSYTYADTGVFTITLIANPGFSCADTAFQTYEVHYPLNPVMPAQVPQCISGNDFDFSVSGNFYPSSATIDWQFSGPSSLSSAHGEQINNVVYSDSGSYQVSVVVSEFGCTDSASSTVTIFPMPTIGFTYPPQDGCVPYQIQFSDSSFSWSPIAFSWDFGDGSFSTDENPSHIYQNPGVYSVTLTIQVDSVCISTQTLELDSIITVHPSPHAQILVNPNSVTIYQPEFTVTDQSTGATTQTIYFDDGTSTTETHPSHVYIPSGHHDVMQIVMNDYGCTDTAHADLYVEPETSIFVPNAFTPNGDGKNDIFRPSVYDVSNYIFRVFNRWGEVIFTDETMSGGWDGIRKDGTKCPNDVYVYQLNFRDKDGIDRVIRGHFTLVR